MYIEFSLIFPDYTLFIYNLQTEQFSSIDVTMIWPDMISQVNEIE